MNLRSARTLLPLAVLLCGLSAFGQQKPQSAPKSEVYVIPFSHLDFFWGGTREECLARGNQIIAKAVALAKEHPDFKFLIEDDNFLANYVETHPNSAELSDLQKLVKSGRIEIAPKWAAIFQNIPSGELHVRNFQIGKRYARMVFGVDPQVAHLGDLPGYVSQFPQIAAKSGVPFAVMTRMGPKDQPLFHWTSPDGSKILAWNTLNHYSWGADLGLHRDLDDERRAKFSAEVAQASARHDGPIFMSWGLDLWAPNEKLIENVRLLNRQKGSVPVRFSTPSEFFNVVSRESNIRDISGEIPSSWPNVISSLPHLWGLASPATNTLLTAEKFAAINHALGYAKYPQEEFDFLWRKLLESMDHNHDGQGGKTGDDRKMQYSQLSLNRGGEILRDMLRNIAERVEFVDPNSHPIVVFNPMNWTRDDVVNAHVTLYGPVAPGNIDDYKHGVQLVDQTGAAVPFEITQYSENISRALELTFIARDIPSLGYRTYYLVPAKNAQVFAPAGTVALDDDKDRKEPRRAMGEDVMENEYYRVTVDKATGRMAIFDKELGRAVVQGAEIVGAEERGGNYIGVEPLSGRTIFGSVDSVALDANSPVRAVLSVRGRVADIPVRQTYTLYRGLKRVDIENEIDWTGGRFVRIQQLFPTGDPNALVTYGVPFGAQSANDIMPGTGPHVSDEISRESWLQSRQVQDWIYSQSAGSGLTIGSNHQLYKIADGVIRAEMVRGARFTSVKVVRGDQVGSLFYPPAGTYRFRFTLSSDRGDWRKAKAHQIGMDAANPLIAVSVVDNVSRKTLPATLSFLSVQGDNIVVSSVKKAESDPSLIVRLYEVGGAPSDTPILFLGKPQEVVDLDLLEQPMNGSKQRTVGVAAYEIKTERLTLSSRN